MPQVPWSIQIRDHPGSTPNEIQDEPDWARGHEHRVGLFNREGRRPGLTHQDDELDKDSVAASDRWQELETKSKEGALVNFRDLMHGETDFRLIHPKVDRSLGWRYVLGASEDWIKNEEEWPANIKKREKEEETKKEKARQEKDDDVSKQGQTGDARKSTEEKNEQPQEEHEWRRQEGENKHHNAYATEGQGQKEDKPEYEKLLGKYTVQEIALLRALQHEKQYIAQLAQNDGKRKSPQTKNRASIAIDEADQFSPDNWLPRSDNLIRLTGKHPMNAEADLSLLFDAGLITPNELHYVRNHGAVPQCLWEFHTIRVANLAGKETEISMDQLHNDFDWINIPVALACDGNRRKELNMIKRSKGFNWGAGAVSCAYWKGAPLRDVLLACGVPDPSSNNNGQRLWVNFEGADEPSEGKYSTCIPLDYAMDLTNDVLLAYEMNDLPLPPDHGYPVRVMIPGYVGGRCVKWLNRIWISEKENDSYYHIWDNRVLPSFVAEKDGEFAEALFRHPDTACNEQNLNSVITKPAQDEKIKFARAGSGETYRVQGYAYDGGGHEVQRVEISLDGGETWLYCIRRFPDAPIRHGKKFWTWLHWHIDVGITHLLNAKSIAVRCWNVFKNTQPEKPTWNSMGMMNNAWYTLQGSIVQGGADKDGDDDAVPSMIWQHPVEPGTKGGGWMKPSVENQIASAKQEAATPQKQFTRAEIEKHDNDKDCWLVVDGKVYDATSVLAWHPGGASAIIGHAGKVHQETSDEFASIHDDYAYQKLKDCVLGVVTAKAKNYVQQNAQKTAQMKAESADGDQKITLQKHKWVPVKLKERNHLSKDTRSYVFQLPDATPELGLGTCQHVQLGFHMKDKMLIRSYTPAKPILPSVSKSQQGPTAGADERSWHDGTGTFELVIKTYFPTAEQPGGAMSNILDVMPLGEEVEIRGPTGEIEYDDSGKFVIEGQEHTFKRVSLVLGGSGITPGYALIARILLNSGDSTEIRVVDANKSEADILLKDELDQLVQRGKGQLKVTHVLSHPTEEWKGMKGHVDEDVIKESLFAPAEGSVVFLCGPPGMIQKAALPALRDWGYEEDKNMWGF